MIALAMAFSSVEYKFTVELDDDLKCLICLEVAKDPLQHEECGKLFCRDCLEKYGKDKPCPNCRAEHSHYYVDKRSKRIIQSLHVKCDNVERKCEWEGTVDMLEKHVATCQFALLPCPKECKGKSGKTNHFMRKDLDHHIEKNCPNRGYNCQYCGEEGKYAAITMIHEKVCLKNIIACPNADCPLTMQRKEVDEHTSKCRYAVAPCKYKDIGCEVKMKRQDMAMHEQDDMFHLHMVTGTTLQLKNDLHMVIDTMLQLKSENLKLKSDIVELRKDLQSAMNMLQLPSKELQTYILTDYQRKKKNGEAFLFTSFYSHPHGYLTALRVCANGNSVGEGTHVSVYVLIAKGGYEAELKWPVKGSVTFTLLNLIEDKNHYSRTAAIMDEHNLRVGRASGYHQFIPHSRLGYDPVINTQYLKDDTLYFRVSADFK